MDYVFIFIVTYWLGKYQYDVIRQTTKQKVLRRGHPHGHVVGGGSVGILLLLLLLIQPDQVDGVNVERVVWVSVAVGGILCADVGGHGRPVAQLEGGVEEVEEHAPGVECPAEARPAGVAPGEAGEAELEAGGLRGGVALGDPGRVILGDRLCEDLQVAGREVDEAEVVAARQADAAEPAPRV